MHSCSMWLVSASMGVRAACTRTHCGSCSTPSSGDHSTDKFYLKNWITINGNYGGEDCCDHICVYNSMFYCVGYVVAFLHCCFAIEIYKPPVFEWMTFLFCLLPVNMHLMSFLLYLLQPASCSVCYVDMTSSDVQWYQTPTHVVATVLKRKGTENAHVDVTFKQRKCELYLNGMGNLVCVRVTVFLCIWCMQTL